LRTWSIAELNLLRHTMHNLSTSLIIAKLPTMSTPNDQNSSTKTSEPPPSNYSHSSPPFSDTQSVNYFARPPEHDPPKPNFHDQVSTEHGCSISRVPDSIEDSLPSSPSGKGILSPADLSGEKEVLWSSGCGGEDTGVVEELRMALGIQEERKRVGG